MYKKASIYMWNFSTIALPTLTNSYKCTIYMAHKTINLNFLISTDLYQNRTHPLRTFIKQVVIKFATRGKQTPLHVRKSCCHWIFSIRQQVCPLSQSAFFFFRETYYYKPQSYKPFTTTYINCRKIYIKHSWKMHQTLNSKRPLKNKPKLYNKSNYINKQ